MRHHGGRTDRSLRLNAAAFALLVAGALAPASCGKSPEAAPTTPSKDFKAEAKSSINEKNADAEMNKLKAEIEADSK